MLLNRESLKQLFRKGKSPSENHFAHLIESCMNKMEDGIGKSAADGLQLSPQGDYDQVVSVYEKMDLPLPAWQIKLLKGNQAQGLSFEKVEKNDNLEAENESRLFLANGGGIGVGTTAPRTGFHIDATAGIKTRVGTYVFGEQPGDGEWHDIITGLTGIQAFEVTARIEGPPGRGKYAVTHAKALSAFKGSRSRNSIRQENAYFGWPWNRIQLRWYGELRNYALQIRTRQHYGFDDDGNLSMIRYHVTNLWDDQLFAEQKGD